MSGSFGKVVIPVVSTCDPTGFNQAKAGLKDLQSAQGGGGGGSSSGGGAPARRSGGSSMDDEGARVFEQTRTATEKYQYQVAKLDDLHKKGKISTETYGRALKDAGKSLPKGPGLGDIGKLAGEAGFGNIGATLAKFATPAMGAAAAAVALFAGFQKAAGEAREVRQESQKLGTTTQFYRSLAWNARDAGVSLGEVSAGLQKVNDKAAAALGGDIAAQAYFSSLGISQDQLAGMSGDSGKLAQMAAQKGSAAQNIQGFGSLEAAGVLKQKTSPFAMDRASNDALEATNLKVQDLPGKAMDAVNFGMSQVAGFFQAGGRMIGGHMSMSEAKGQMIQEAEAKDAEEAAARRKAANVERGTSRGVGLLTARENAEYDRGNDKNFDYSAMASRTGISAETFKARAETQRQQKELAFDSPYANIYEAAQGNHDILRRQRNEGTLDERQEYRGQVANMEQLAQQRAPTLSNAENMSNKIAISGMKWNDPGNAAADLKARQAEVDSAKAELAKAKADEAKGEDDARVPVKKWTREDREEKLAAAQKNMDDAKAKPALQQRDAARELGDQLTDYVQGLTASGGQAGAYGINTVAGASQVMGSEFEMSKSAETNAILKAILEQLVASHKLDRKQADAVGNNLGYRYADPISALFGGK